MKFKECKRCGERFIDQGWFQWHISGFCSKFCKYAKVRKNHDAHVRAYRRYLVQNIDPSKQRRK